MGKYIRKTFEQMEIDSYERANTETLSVEQINDEECLVTNFDHNSIYKVIMDGDYILDCDCPHHTFRRVKCKHMIYASYVMGKIV